MAVVLIDLPYQDQIDISSSPTSEGFSQNRINYGGKVTQVSFDGASVEASREEVWKVNWSAINYASPEDVALGEVNQVEYLRDFYRQVQLGRVRWTPFEISTPRIWEVIPNSLTIKQVAGCIFSASLSLKFLYNE